MHTDEMSDHRGYMRQKAMQQPSHYRTKAHSRGKKQFLFAQ